MLASVPWKRRVNTHVHKLQALNGEATLHSSKIALLFHDYCVDLYNLEG